MFAFRTSQGFPIIHQLVKFYIRLRKPATLTGKQQALRGLFLVEKYKWLVKIVQMVEELSISHHGLLALTSGDLDQTE